jgi:hypothetical protein
MSRSGPGKQECGGRKRQGCQQTAAHEFLQKRINARLYVRESLGVKQTPALRPP